MLATGPLTLTRTALIRPCWGCAGRWWAWRRRRGAGPGSSIPLCNGMRGITWRSW